MTNYNKICLTSNKSELIFVIDLYYLYDEFMKTDIIIAGAGPVGMSLALALAREGISVLVLEKLDELSHEARASTIHPPTLEFFDEIGIIDDILANGLRIENLQFWERQTRELVADFPYKLIEKDTKYPFRFQCPQSTVTRIILKHIEGTNYGKVLFNHEFSRFSKSENGVEVFAETPAGETKFECKYLIGCDGANSKVRENLGLSFDGKTYEDRFLLVSSDIDLSEIFPNMGTVAYIFDPEEWVIIMTLPDTVRLVFRLKPFENPDEATQIENVRKRISKFLETHLSYEIKAVSTYHVHQRVTEKFRVGNVILAGDAAHINNPTGGMGMNSGIHDARDLANALIRIFDGEDEYLLDEYAKNRKETAVKMVQAMTDSNYKNLAESDAAMREKRNRDLREAAEDKAKAREYLLKTAMLADRI
jgi:3-(3-hydroxy-phenyl)propionate hydroxylase